MTMRSKTIETLAVPVHVIERDISEGICGLPGKCMEKIAIERALRKIDPRGGDHKVRIDAGVVRFVFRGFKFESITPKIPKRSLIQFDKELRTRKRAAKAGESFQSKVKPHVWKLVATKAAKIQPMTSDRMKQIYAARARRETEGRPDRTKYDLHRRVMGLANI